MDHSQKPLISFSPFSRSQDTGCLIWTEVRGQIPEWKGQGLLDLVVSISVLLMESARQRATVIPCLALFLMFSYYCVYVLFV